MALENIATKDLILKFENTAGPTDIQPIAVPPDPPTKEVSLDASKTATQSTTCKILGKEVCSTSVDYVFSTTLTRPCPFTSGGLFTFVAGGGTILATAGKCKAEGQLVLRQGDSGTCTGTWTKIADGSTLTCTCDVEISDAGQDKVKGQ